MSRAFVKDTDGDDPAAMLPERPISPHPNFVTSEGLALIEAEIARLGQALVAAQSQSDRTEQVKIARDMRYWTARRATAEVIATVPDSAVVQFGSRVTIKRDGGRTATYRIVGEDEAEPAHGTLSYVSPLARALLGKSVGDVVRAGSGEAEIIAIG